MSTKKISIIGVPSDYGQRRRGVDMGPSAIRYAGVIERLENLGYEVEDKGNIQLSVTNDGHIESEKLLNFNEVIKISSQLSTEVENVLNEKTISSRIRRRS